MEKERATPESDGEYIMNLSGGVAMIIYKSPRGNIVIRRITNDEEDFIKIAWNTSERELEDIVEIEGIRPVEGDCYSEVIFMTCRGSGKLVVLEEGKELKEIEIKEGGREFNIKHLRREP